MIAALSIALSAPTILHNNISIEAAKKIKNGKYKIGKVKFQFCGDVPNDLTGNWRLSKIHTKKKPTKYALKYYKKFFKNDDEIHAIINTKNNTTIRISVVLNLLDVTILKHIKDEEKDASVLFGGDVIKQYLIDIKTGKIEK